MSSAQNEFLSWASKIAPSAITKHCLVGLVTTETTNQAADASFLPGLKPPSEKKIMPAARAIRAAALESILHQLVLVCMAFLAR